MIGSATGDLVIDDPNISQPHAAVIRRKQLAEGDVFLLSDHELRVTYMAD